MERRKKCRANWEAGGVNINQTNYCLLTFQEYGKKKKLLESRKIIPRYVQSHIRGERRFVPTTVQGEGSAFSAGHEGRSVCPATLTAQGAPGTRSSERFPRQLSEGVLAWASDEARESAQATASLRRVHRQAPAVGFPS